MPRRHDEALALKLKRVGGVAAPAPGPKRGGQRDFRTACRLDACPQQLVPREWAAAEPAPGDSQPECVSASSAAVLRPARRPSRLRPVACPGRHVAHTRGPGAGSPHQLGLACSQLSLPLPSERSKAATEAWKLTFGANLEIIRLGRGLRPLIRYLSHDAISEHSRAKMEPTNLYRSRFPIASARVWLGPGATLIKSNGGK